MVSDPLLNPKNPPRKRATSSAPVNPPRDPAVRLSDEQVLCQRCGAVLVRRSMMKHENWHEALKGALTGRGGR